MRHLFAVSAFGERLTLGGHELYHVEPSALRAVTDAPPTLTRSPRRRGRAASARPQDRAPWRFTSSAPILCCAMAAKDRRCDLRAGVSQAAPRQGNQSAASAPLANLIRSMAFSAALSERKVSARPFSLGYSGLRPVSTRPRVSAERLGLAARCASD